jgi:hypothetical protein
MFGSSVLEAAIGVVFVYLLLALICTAINEWIATIVNKRGKNLFDGIRNLLNDPRFTGLAQQLYTHGLVDCISQGASDPDKPNRLPSYLPSSTFSLALLDILGSQGLQESWTRTVERRRSELDAARVELQASPGQANQQKVRACEAALQAATDALRRAERVAALHGAAAEAARKVTGAHDLRNLQAASAKLQEALSLGRAIAAEFPDPLANIEQGVAKLPNGHTKETLFVLLVKTRREAAALGEHVESAHHQLQLLQSNVEQWFDGAMERVGGWYKRWTQRIQLVAAFVVVAIANADTIALASRLTRDNALRGSVVGAAAQAVQNGATNAMMDPGSRTRLLQEAEELALPLGWSCTPSGLDRCDHIPRDCWGWAAKVLGLVISGFAVAMGAPFWFDTLSKFVNIRGAGTPPGELQKSAPRRPTA